MKIIFESSLLSCQGGGVVINDYAHFNQEMLGNESIIIAKTQKSLSKICKFKHDPETIDFIKNKFNFNFYNDWTDVKKIIKEHNADILYTVTGGIVFTDEQVNYLDIKTCVHSVFGYLQPSGDKFAYVSEWLSKSLHGGKYPFVPHMINMPNIDDDLRETLNIPKDATVFGRHGSSTTFNIPFAYDVVNRIVQERNDIYFLFLNTDNVCENFNHRRLINHPRIINLPKTFDIIEKTKFINSCDAMLHARINGESFGLSPAEFSIKNKPVITWTSKDIHKYSKYGHDMAHIEMLGDKGIYYDDYNDLYNILKNFYPQPEKNWDAYSEKYNPKSVMEKFKKVFID